MNTRWHSRKLMAQRGIALVLVLWVLALMVLFAAAFSVSVRSETQLGFSASERTRAGLAAEAGVRRAILELMSPSKPVAEEETDVEEDEAPSPRERRQLEFRFDDMDVSMEIIPESAFVDINVSAEPLIKGVVEAAARSIGRRDEKQLVAVTDAILDWRDVDDRRRDEGAEERDYRAAGRPGPRNQPFLSVGELAEVAGIDRPLFDAMRPLVTVFSFSPQIDPMAAAGPVLEALPGIEPDVVSEFLSARDDGASESEIVDLLTPSRRYLARRATPTYTVMAQAVTPAGVRAVRRAVVKVNPRSAQRLAILAWFQDAGGQPLPSPNTTADTDDSL